MNKKTKNTSPTWGAAFPPREGARASLRWCENPEAAGFRFAGHADDLAPRGIRHTGWYASEDNCTGETVRGAVWRLPHGRFVAGFTESQSDGACLEVSGYGCVFDNECDAAYRADSLAETFAEQAREHDEAWRAGLNAREAELEAIALRGQLLDLLREMKPRRKQEEASPAICAALRARVDAMLETIADARKRRDRLRSEKEWLNRKAFGEGYASA